MEAVRSQRPRFSVRDAERISHSTFGVRGNATEIVSHADQNFRIRSAAGSFTLKLAHAGEERGVLDLQECILARLQAPLERRVPQLRAALDGSACSLVRDESGSAYWARMLSWLPGRVLARVHPHSPALLEDFGAQLGNLDRALEGFEHPAAGRAMPWRLEDAPAAIAANREAITAPRRRALTQRTLEQIGSRPWDSDLRRSVIHNDANDHNVLVDDTPGAQRVSGLIDFGDAVRTWTLAEVAIAATYVMFSKCDPLGAAAHVLRGYHGAYPIPERELECLLDLVRLRLITSVCVSAAAAAAEPDRDYLRISEEPAWSLLESLEAVPAGLALATFRHACGFEPCANRIAVERWIGANSENLAPVLGIDLRSTPLAALDLSIASPSLDRIGAIPTVDGWQRELELLRATTGAEIIVGNYDEPRACYAGELFAEPTEDFDERRTVHLGIDLFLPEGAPVHAPLAATVHSVHDNAGALDYGPTVILRHEPEPGVEFHTLYGHLSRESVAGLRAGDAVEQGQAIARLGAPEENGGWAPHLHFQCITDLLGQGHEFPGVASPSRRAIWRSLCPDPRSLLGLQASPKASSDLQTRRAHALGPSLSVSYRRPLTIVRGRGVHLFDDAGQRYLDAVNNVPHVGHAHPRVVRAGQEQMAVLNTNTRYLHPRLVDYAERLGALFPDPLEVVFLVCSGSEANELALRLARATTRTRDVIVHAAGYHGNTSALVELSHYKFAGPGGFAPPEHVNVVPLPDTYRGEHRDGDAADRYIDHVQRAARRIAQSGDGTPTFLAEALPGCGGQIVPPPGYLAGAFEAVRAQGGICIADEVQTGFARVGSHYWAFEAQGATPDIVTLGKPIGNGHPLGAVVTTRAIAQRFANGMEYFNTFGGNAVSCAIGMAVLDVMEAEGLQENALRTGALLLQQLRELEHPLVGDVRGAGLYAGVELVRDAETLEPAGCEAGHVAERMRERGILISTDGPHHNVLKIKPPIVFAEDDAERLTSTLAAVLKETCLER